MTITLTSAQQAWIGEQISRGEFASESDAVRRLLDERIAERQAETDDLAWARPYVEVALAQVERGEVVTLDEFTARNVERLARFPG